MDPLPEAAVPEPSVVEVPGSCEVEVEPLPAAAVPEPSVVEVPGSCDVEVEPLPAAVVPEPSVAEVPEPVVVEEPEPVVADPGSLDETEVEPSDDGWPVMCRDCAMVAPSFTFPVMVG